ncbi:hypothetical protein BU24DRAFT_157845 [Aaosphaeria arxii CBS 175.79]|uniref:Uncharacterized protein n=1 Tax=Aaosphaeria arxii CBS 175.79 TaxID=1450172 RepID=A0A6A5XWQ0_9PLEO|nr:uncharacterized protein BU24DRAFT_157845 [Aaosphaeria arxii CBS 175.79]KAF2017758.1 hypothetical protein BU24DRAFT_157845 [Aaosphaeria arxii CBS 175.79]
MVARPCVISVGSSSSSTSMAEQGKLVEGHLAILTCERAGASEGEGKGIGGDGHIKFRHPTIDPSSGVNNNNDDTVVMILTFCFPNVLMVRHRHDRGGGGFSSCPGLLDGLSTQYSRSGPRSAAVSTSLLLANHRNHSYLVTGPLLCLPGREVPKYLVSTNY